jgi:hypothetical protein
MLINKGANRSWEILKKPMTTQPSMKDPSVLSVFIGVYQWSISKKVLSSSNPKVRQPN